MSVGRIIAYGSGRLAGTLLTPAAERGCGRVFLAPSNIFSCAGIARAKAPFDATIITREVCPVGLLAGYGLSTVSMRAASANSAKVRERRANFRRHVISAPNDKTSRATAVAAQMDENDIV